VDKSSDTEFEKNHKDDILVTLEPRYPSSETCGCDIHIGQMLTKRSDKVYPAGDNDIPIGVAAYSSNKGYLVAMYYSGCVVRIIAGRDIQKGNYIIPFTLGNRKGFAAGTKRALSHNKILGIAIKDIKKKECGMIYLCGEYIPKYILDEIGCD